MTNAQTDLRFILDDVQYNISTFLRLKAKVGRGEWVRGWVDGGNALSFCLWRAQQQFGHDVAVALEWVRNGSEQGNHSVPGADGDTVPLIWFFLPRIRTPSM
jgi:hypothetical protein